MDTIRLMLFGRASTVRLWHPRWSDYRPITEGLRDYLQDSHQRLLMITDNPTRFAARLADGGARVMQLRRTPFMAERAETFEPFHGGFDVCLLEVVESEISDCDEFVDRVATLIKPNGKIMILVYNTRDKDPTEFAGSVGFHAARLLRPATVQLQARFVEATRFRWFVLTSMMNMGRLAHRSAIVGIPLLAAGGWLLSAASLVANLVGKRRSGLAFRQGSVASSLFMQMRVDSSLAKDVHKYSAFNALASRRRQS